MAVWEPVTDDVLVADAAPAVIIAADVLSLVPVASLVASPAPVSADCPAQLSWAVPLNARLKPLLEALSCSTRAAKCWPDALAPRESDAANAYAGAPTM